MSGDLISRSRLLEILNYNKAIHEDENGETRQLIAIDINKMIEYVEKMPTAYNVDKVVEKLEEEKGIAFLVLANTGDKMKDVVYDEVMAYLKAAIEIVKAGGVE